MAVYKDKQRGTWYVSVYYTNWKGESDRKVKRGFKTRKDAVAWENTFLNKNAGDLNMTFAEFYDIYKSDLEERLKENTWVMKESVIELKILPYFKKKKMCEIKVSDVIAWQKEMMAYRDANGQPYATGYLKTIHNQLSAIFNHAVRFYELPSNPAAKVGNMGRENTKEMLFWTKEEYTKFSDAMMDKPLSYYAFEMLYWCGIRLGELLALTYGDFDFVKQTVRINKSYQCIKGRGICVEYELLEINKQLGFSPVPIVYSDGRSVFQNLNPDTLDYDVTEVFIKSLTSKSPEWSYEKEWRIIQDNTACGSKWDSANKGALLNMIIPSSIILGCMVNQDYEKSIYEYCKNNKINLFKMEKDKDFYRLNKVVVLEF